MIEDDSRGISQRPETVWTLDRRSDEDVSSEVGEKDQPGSDGDMSW